jgi:hypothetical protein
MNRFVQSRSLFFSIVVWCFVTALFCDATDLDDLLHGIVVLHDDEEITAIDSCVYYGSDTTRHAERRERTGLTQLEQSGPPSRLSVRLVIDQDSPSLAADESQTVFESLFAIQDSSTPSSDIQLPTELLHIRSHSLLI